MFSHCNTSLIKNNEYQYDETFLHKISFRSFPISLHSGYLDKRFLSQLYILDRRRRRLIIAKAHVRTRFYLYSSSIALSYFHMCLSHFEICIFRLNIFFNFLNFIPALPFHLVFQLFSIFISFSMYSIPGFPLYVRPI